VIDYGSGNLRSVAKALERSGMRPEVTGDVAALQRCDAVVLPGVGAFRDAVKTLRAKQLDAAVRRGIESGRPHLGICLGLQLLFEESDEHGIHAGFGILGGSVSRFPAYDARGVPLRVPHIGWNEVRYQGAHPILETLPARDTYYFVHAYRAVPRDSGVVVGIAEYGEEFAAAVARESLVAVQFHPEKSQAAGKRLLDAFHTWVAQC